MKVFIYSLVFTALLASAFGFKLAYCPPDDGGVPIHFPKDGDCRHFWKCSNGVAVEQMCPVGLHWNAAEEYCDWPWLANCDDQAAQ